MKLPILPLNVPNLLADTSHMSPSEFGAYMRILLTMWAHGGTLENRPARLARIARCDPRTWKRMEPIVLAPMLDTNGTLTQKRLSAVWDEVQQLRRERRKLAARARKDLM